MPGRIAIEQTVIRRLLQRLRDRWAALHSPSHSLAGLKSEQEALAAEMSSLDAQAPGWDEATRLAGARNAVRIGLPRDIVVSIYGEELTRRAENHGSNQASALLVGNLPSGSPVPSAIEPVSPALVTQAATAAIGFALRAQQTLEKSRTLPAA